MTVSVFDGDADNVKLTNPEDFSRIEARELATLGDVRTGNGYDVHAFAEGDHVWLGGIKIAHERGLSGHSDADAGLHALVDAILGALADGDIGAHFPPSDPKWKGASSDRFLRFAVERVRARGGRVVHLDLTIVCEAPKIGPHRDAMRARIAEIAGISIDRVGVKATTSEKLVGLPIMSRCSSGVNSTSLVCAFGIFSSIHRCLSSNGWSVKTVSLRWVV